MATNEDSLIIQLEEEIAKLKERIKQLKKMLKSLTPAPLLARTHHSGALSGTHHCQ